MRCLENKLDISKKIWYNIYVNKKDKKFFMKTKERKNIAKKIAEAEYIIHTSDDLEARSRAE